MLQERIKFKMFYYLPNQSELFCPPNVFETYNESELKQAINIAHGKGYKIAEVEKKIEHVYVIDK